jgi:hypothetical protein
MDLDTHKYLCAVSRRGKPPNCSLALMTEGQSNIVCSMCNERGHQEVIGSVNDTIPTVISLYTTFEVLKSCPPLLFSRRNTVPLPLVTKEILDFSLGMKEC